MGQLRHPLAEVRVGVTVPPGPAPGDDLLGREEGGRTPEEVLQREREIGHCAPHRDPRLLQPATRPQFLAVAIPPMICLISGAVSPVMARPENASGPGITLRRS